MGTRIVEVCWLVNTNANAKWEDQKVTQSDAFRIRKTEVQICSILELFI